jgi:hypothetical protein
MRQSIQKILLNLYKYLFSEINIKTHHLFYLFTPLKNNLINQKCCIKHRGILCCKNRLRGIFHPFWIKTSMIENDIYEKNHTLLLQRTKNRFKLFIFLFSSSFKKIIWELQMTLETVIRIWCSYLLNRG